MKRFIVVLVALFIVSLVCVSCAPRRRRRQSSCEDRVAQCQSTLQPHYCYFEHNRRLCCRTCEQLRRNTPGCPYGDHNAQITRKDDDGVEQTFTCRSYIDFYGDFHCRNEDRFRQYCCESCQQQTLV